MVKNTHGGNKGKSMARKSFTKLSSILRVSQSKEEVYGVVITPPGNNAFHCHCIDGIVRLVHIRGKFTGRGKRDNIVARGGWVLVGVRNWSEDMNKAEPIMSSSRKQKLPECDLLGVYSEQDKEKLKTTVDCNWPTLINNDPTRVLSRTNAPTDVIMDDIIFSNENADELNALLNEMNSGKNVTVSLIDTNEEINIDDI